MQIVVMCKGVLKFLLVMQVWCYKKMERRVVFEIQVVDFLCQGVGDSVDVGGRRSGVVVKKAIVCSCILRINTWTAWNWMLDSRNDQEHWDNFYNSDDHFYLLLIARRKKHDHIGDSSCLLHDVLNNKIGVLETHIWNKLWLCRWQVVSSGYSFGTLADNTLSWLMNQEDVVSEEEVQMVPKQKEWLWMVWP